MYRRVPKRGFTNPDAIFLTPLNLDKLSAFIDSGRISTEGVITMKTLFDAHICGRKINGQGIKLLGTGDKNFKHKIEVEVTRISARAKKAIEAAGGVAREVYYNDIGLRYVSFNVIAKCFHFSCPLPNVSHSHNQSSPEARKIRKNTSKGTSSSSSRL